MTTDLHDLLSRVADSAPVPSLLDGVRARRRHVARRRTTAGLAAAAVVVAGGGAVGWRVHQTDELTARFGAAAGYQHIRGPAGWPSGRLAPPITVPTDGFHGQDMHLEPLPAGYVPKVDAVQAYAICTEHGPCNRNGGAVMTLAMVTYDFGHEPVLRRVVWLGENGPSECSAAGGQSAPRSGGTPTPASPVPPTTRQCTATIAIDAATGAALFVSADGP
ncbi:hypothetical protein acdb102_03940 [Acidothermaceae bacterium B102]|nr:hypothetical protein acdb102_03940 [Acidothermaceae bacterium B102]